MKKPEEKKPKPVDSANLKIDDKILSFKTKSTENTRYSVSV